MTTMEAKGAISERNHPLSIGSGHGVMNGTTRHLLAEADLVLAVGTSLTRHGMVTPIPGGKTIIHVTNDAIDLNKGYAADHPILGDAKLVLRQFIDCARNQARGCEPRDTAAEIVRVHETWLAEWMAMLTCDEVPINPHRVIWELIQNAPPTEAIVTHDAGNPRYEIMPFYETDGPRTYLG